MLKLQQDLDIFTKKIVHIYNLDGTLNHIERRSVGYIPKGSTAFLGDFYVYKFKKKHPFERSTGIIDAEGWYSITKFLKTPLDIPHHSIEKMISFKNYTPILTYNKSLYIDTDIVDGDFNENSYGFPVDLSLGIGIIDSNELGYKRFTSGSWTYYRDVYNYKDYRLNKNGLVESKRIKDNKYEFYEQRTSLSTE